MHPGSPGLRKTAAPSALHRHGRLAGGSLLSTGLPAILMAIPRSPLSYPLYVADFLLVVKLTAGKTIAVLLLLLGFTGLSLLFNALAGSTVSLTAYAIAVALMLPLVLAAFGAPILRQFNGRKFIRYLNLFTFLSSMFNLAMLGFPLELPYVDYLPDAFNGSHGAGGAKIVTIIGFFGICEAVSRQDRTTIARDLLFYCSIANFFVPNFILGIICGIFGLSIFFWKRKFFAIVALGAFLTASPYIYFRMETINNTFSEQYGIHPKAFAFKIVVDQYLSQPHTILFGAGLGQFGSEPAQWASPINTYVGSQEIPKVPGLFAGDAHREHLAPHLLRFKRDIYAVDSSANKPYSGVTVMLAEFGVPATLLIALMLYSQFWARRTPLVARSALLFFASINMLDVQIDSPWLGLLMLATLEIARSETRGRR